MSYLAKNQFKLPEVFSQKSIPSAKQIPKGESQALKNGVKNVLQTPKSIQKNGNQLQKEFDMNAVPLSAKSAKKLPGKENPKLPPLKGQDQLTADLINSIETRLKDAESTTNNQRNQIKVRNLLFQEQDKVLSKLREENQFLKSLRKGGAEACQKMDVLRKQNKELQGKVGEMVTFLQKYGLKSDGNKIEGSGLDGKKLKKDIKKPRFDYKLPTDIDVGTVRNRIDDLNAGLQSEGKGTEIYVQNGIHKFRKAQPLSLQFYKNGIDIKGYPFYCYKEEKSLKILSDILDGYFPYVLKERYPNGIFLNVVDKTQRKYNEEDKKQKGQVIGGTDKEKQGKQEDEGESLNTQKSQKKVGIVQPQGNQVQKRMNIRKPLKKIMSQKVLPKIEQRQQAQDYEQVDGNIIFLTAEHKSMNKNDYPPDQLCTLKIRTHEGKICILQLGKISKMKDVYNWMGRLIRQPYRLLSNCPRRVYEQNESENLQQLGFLPNALLHTHIIQQNPQ